MSDSEIKIDLSFIDETADQMSAFLDDNLNSEVVVGEAIELEEVTLVPLSAVSVGLGSGGGTGEGDGQDDAATISIGNRSGSKQGYGKGAGAGSGAGCGGSVKPVAVIAFTADGVEVLRVPKRTSFVDRLVEKEGLLDKLLGTLESRFRK